MKLLSILVVTTILTSFTGQFSLRDEQSASVKLTRPKLTVELTADKAVYRAKDDITLKVTIANDSLLDDVFIYGELGFGYAASLTLFRRDAKGREVPTRFIDDSRGNPPNLSDPNTFVKLYPGHFLGTTYESTIYNLNLESPGKYRLWVEYHSPISKSEVRLAPFWGSQDGNIRSNVLEIVVR